jgi:signal transduction histidine kinase
MRHSIILIFFLSLQCVAADCKEPDLTRYKKTGDKIKAWIKYCDYLLGYGDGAKEDYPALAIAGKKGMEIAQKTDKLHQSLFSFYAGAGYEFSGNNDSALRYYRISARYAEDIGNADRLLNVYKQLMWIGNDAEQEDILQKTAKMLDTTANSDRKQQIADIHFRYYRDKNRYEQALQYSLKILELRRQGKKPKPGDDEFINTGVTLTQIGDMYYRMGQLNKAMEYLHEATQYVSDQYMDGASTLYNEMLGIFLDLKQADSAAVYYKKVYELAEKGYKSKESLSYANRSYADYYLKEGKPDSALQYGERAYTLSVEDGGDLSLLESNTAMGNIYYKLGNYSKALKHLLAVPSEARDYDREAYNQLQFLKAECYKSLGDWKKATEYYRDYAFTKDTLLSEGAKRNIAEMEAKYQNRDKQRQIEEVKKERLFLLAGIVLLSFVLVLLFVNYQNKRRNARILDAKNAALYEANKTKATLFSVISHDLRSPISQLYQYLQLQKDNPNLLNEDMKKKHSERISNATASLLETMEDMLVWSKTQMDRFVPASEDVNVREIVQDTLSLLGPDAEAKSLSISNKVPQGIRVVSDTNLLKIIVRNLLQNAIQYSMPATGIEVSAENTGKGVCISIKDEGLGMSDEVIAVLQNNEQNLSSNRKGLGWSLIKEMAGSINASIGIKRNIPRGTTVSLHVPYSKK